MRAKLIPVLILLFALAGCGMQTQAASPQKVVSTPSTATLCSSKTWTTSLPPQVPAGASTSSTASNAIRMNMGPHMKMTAYRKPTTAEVQRAEAIVHMVTTCMAKYKDYRLALHDGYQIFTPDVPQDVYHFANVRNFGNAQTIFDPTHPTALLYKPIGKSYQLVGVMFSAPADLTEDQLNQLFPLGAAPWHLHVNICLPGGDSGRTLFPANSPFGLDGWITTKAVCTKVGGTFVPQMFGWMVHIDAFGTEN